VPVNVRILAVMVLTTMLTACGGGGGSGGGGGMPGPTLQLDASAGTVAPGGSVTLTWSSTNATTCTASGGWSGGQSLSGSTSSGALNATTTFTLLCTGTGGDISRSTTVTVSAAASRFPLRVEAGKRYLVDAQGQPFLINGDTAWSLIVQLNAAQANQYLDDRQQRGVNTILVNLIDLEFGVNAPSNAAGQAPFSTTGDYATINDAYFDFAETVIDAAAARGMLVLLTPSYMGFPGASPVEGWYAEMVANGTTKLREYGRQLGLRFAGRDNILWVHGGDRDPPANPGLALINAIEAGIRESDPTNRWLDSYHAERGTSAADSVAGNETWLEVDTLYTSSSDVVDEAFHTFQTDTRPYFLFEARYEDNGGDGRFIRQQAYQALLSGASGHVMGNDPMWCFGTDCGAFNYTPAWQQYLDSEGAESLPHIKSLFDAVNWWLLVPDVNNQFLTGGISSGADRAVAAVASDDSFALVYLPDSRAVTVDLTDLPGPNVRARWYNPALGSYTTANGSPFAASGSETLSPPSAGDWVLVLDSL
jgi:hypothetical protein